MGRAATHRARAVVLEPPPGSASDSDALCAAAEERDYLLIEHAHALARLTPYAVICVLLLWGVLFHFAWGRIPRMSLLLWAVMLGAWIAVALPTALRMRRGQGDLGRARGWLRQHVAAAVLAGAIWGSAALLLPGVGEPPHAAIVLLVALLAAAGCAAYSPYLPALYGFAGAFAATLLALGSRRARRRRISICNARS
jgi:hypothetical protein